MKPSLATESRHTIESKSFSGKTEFHHRAFCQLYTARMEPDMQVSTKGPCQLFIQDCKGYKSTA